MKAASPSAAPKFGVGVSFASGPFSHENFRALAVGAVVVVSLFKHACLPLVIVIVDDVGRHPFHRHRSDDLKVGIFSL